MFNRMRHKRTNRRGFTLVEMLVVIVIITALAALLIPAVMISIRRARQAKIGLEVANLSKALERYKMDFGEYPPDFALSALEPNEAARVAKTKQLIGEHLASVFRRRGALDLPMASATAVADKQLAQLNPGNALLFWLKGFSPDPQYPVSGTGERSPLMDFDQSRLKNISKVAELRQLVQSSDPDPNDTQHVSPGLVWGYHQGDAPPRQPDPPRPQVVVFADGLYPAGDSTKQPYIYYNSASYNKDSYRLLSNPPNPTNAPAVQWANANNVVPPYVSSTLSDFSEPDRFQIISAGLDGEYGVIPTGNRADITKYPTVPSGKNLTKEHRDNITSFSEGPINDMINE